MSFWSEFPGPHWWDCIESLNPCKPSPYGLSNPQLSLRGNPMKLPRGFLSIQLSSRHAKVLEKFLREEFTMYPRCKLVLPEQRIQEGFLLDNWIGVGIFTLDKQLVGCCISKPLGRLKVSQEILPNSGIVDYFCVHHTYRKLGFASFLLHELVNSTGKQGRLVHLFLKEGLPLWKLPPLYTSQYIYRKKMLSNELKENLGSMGIGLRGAIQRYTHADFLPLRKFIANLPYQLSGDSELFSFNYRGHSVYLCITNAHHRTVPEGHRIGELAWILPQTAEVPLSIQVLAVETCIDCSKYEIVIMDKKIPHNFKNSWIQDAPFSWYIYNYNPGTFFTTKPFLII